MLLTLKTKLDGVGQFDVPVTHVLVSFKTMQMLADGDPTVGQIEMSGILICRSNAVEDNKIYLMNDRIIQAYLEKGGEYNEEGI